MGEARDEAPVGGTVGGLLQNRNRNCDTKMHIDVNFCLKFVRIRNIASHTSSGYTELGLSQHVKQCVLASLKRDVLLIYTPPLFTARC